MNKKLLMSLVAVGVVASGLVLNTTLAKADDARFGDIVTKLSEKFGLQEDEVQAVLDSVRDEHMQEMQARYEERLATLVNEGKLTEEQKQALVSKHNEMRGSHDEFQAWAKEQGIDLSLIRPMGFGMKGGRR